MKLLVIGGGGREHAICRKLLASPLVSDVYCAPGNPGMKQDGIQLVGIDQENHQGLIGFAKAKEIAWTFVGPEQPLVAGIVDEFQEAGLTIFGPTRKAAQIEGSKEFAKELMNKYHIPTAAYQVFDDFTEAWQYVEEQGLPLVFKADGLAAGKGVIIPETMVEARLALEQLLVDRCFGDSSQKVVIEEFLVGEEFSLLAFVHEGKIYPLEIAQDHKRALVGDQGLNTGGMGAYCPVPQISKEYVTRSMEEVIEPTVAAMIVEDAPFSGVLYAGLIATATGPKVIEFNARMGDPEAQVLLEHLTSDLAAIITAILAGNEPVFAWDEKQIHLGVVLASKGYPDEYERGMALPTFRESPDLTVYYSGVKHNERDELVADGGRVLMVVTKGQTIQEAQITICQELAKYDLSQYHYREDIGYRGIEG